jgi:heme/copper-type cytochrome/quinol oxidase subunit 4
MNEYTNSTNAERGRSRSGFVNALLGAVVMTVFSWIPFAPVVGGALSGYLDAGDRRGEGAASRRGIRIGALAGLLATVPAVLVLAFVGSIVTVGWFGMSMGGGMGPRVALGLPLFAWALVTFVLVLALVYHVALSALGGWLGAELERRVEHGEAERDHGSRADRESPETADRDADEDDAADAGDGRSER